jgi:hypothetical protein
MSSITTRHSNDGLEKIHHEDNEINKAVEMKFSKKI